MFIFSMDLNAFFAVVISISSYCGDCCSVKSIHSDSSSDLVRWLSLTEVLLPESSKRYQKIRSYRSAT